jgi:hypothetical protein
VKVVPAGRVTLEDEEVADADVVAGRVLHVPPLLLLVLVGGYGAGGGFVACVVRPVE